MKEKTVKTWLGGAGILYANQQMLEYWEGREARAHNDKNDC